MMKQITYTQEYQIQTKIILQHLMIHYKIRKQDSTYTLHETTELQTHSKQIIPFYTPSFFKYKNYFLNFFYLQIHI